MKALKIIVITIGCVLAIAVVVIAVQSPESHIERSVVIHASPGAVFPYFNNLHNFNEWSPWHSMDSAAVFSYEGPESGVGAKASWKSSDTRFGEGSQWILESEENHRVKSGLLIAGRKGQFFTEVMLEPTDSGTKVIYAYYGDVSNTTMANAAAGKFFNLFMSEMLGSRYDDGLKNLKALIESRPAESAPLDSAAAQP